MNVYMIQLNIYSNILMKYIIKWKYKYNHKMKIGRTYGWQNVFWNYLTLLLLFTMLRIGNALQWHTIPSGSQAVTNRTV